ncbi:MAG TPA: hypothetical protein VN844_10400 [Pyrinomonadaceae bacterium]|nr:hypothetical protein [Pyrinomonadaceae bacterium]
MKQLAMLATVILVFATTALAQDDYKKYEFFGGYSALFIDNLAGDTGSPAVDDVLGEKQTLRGFNVAAGYNFHKYIGAKFDYSLHLREDNFSRPLGSGTVDTTLQNILGGIQVKNNSEDGPTSSRLDTHFSALPCRSSTSIVRTCRQSSASATFIQTKRASRWRSAAGSTSS